MRATFPRMRRHLLAAAVAAVLVSGCATTGPLDRDRLVDPAMAFDEDEALTYLRHKVEAAREGALGGYGTSAAGGCGCQ